MIKRIKYLSTLQLLPDGTVGEKRKNPISQLVFEFKFRVYEFICKYEPTICVKDSSERLYDSWMIGWTPVGCSSVRLRGTDVKQKVVRNSGKSIIFDNQNHVHNHVQPHTIDGEWLASPRRYLANSGLVLLHQICAALTQNSWSLEYFRPGSDFSSPLSWMNLW